MKFFRLNALASMRDSQAFTSVIGSILAVFNGVM